MGGSGTLGAAGRCSTVADLLRTARRTCEKTLLGTHDLDRQTDKDRQTHANKGQQAMNPIQKKMRHPVGDSVKSFLGPLLGGRDGRRVDPEG